MSGVHRQQGVCRLQAAVCMVCHLAKVLEVDMRCSPMPPEPC